MPPPKDAATVEQLLKALSKLSADFQALTAQVQQWREEHRADRAKLEARLARLEQNASPPPKP
jgi:septal ring factor EnvC (AmiA/AmiB activator)